MINILDKLSDSAASIDELKELLGIDEKYPSHLSDDLANKIVTLFLQGQWNYDQATLSINHLFMIWLSKPYTEEFGKTAWLVYDVFDKADEYYDEENLSESTQYAKIELEKLVL